MLLTVDLNHLFFIALFINVIGGIDLYLGEKCQPRNDKSEKGICTLITECPEALRFLRKSGRIPFLRCGFQDTFEVTCCPTTGERYGLDSPRMLDRHCKNIVENSIPPLDLHIIGGDNAELGEFPHMVALGYLKDDGYDFSCGGTLISDTYILTAAHCLDNIQKIMPTIARLGVVNVGSNKFDPETDIRISDYFIHAERTTANKYHDVALLKLEQPAQYSVALVPACLYTGETIPTAPLTVTGWGQTSTTKNIRSKILQKANVTMVASSICEKDYQNWRKLPSGIKQGQFCAGDPLGRTDACQGDSGGPIQALTSTDGHYRILGVISFGNGCASRVPGVYTRLYPYLDWIENVIWPNGM